MALEINAKKFTRFVAVDPGWHTAFAVFAKGELNETRIENCPVKLKSDREAQIKYMIDTFRRVLKDIGAFDALILEGVQVYSSSVKSQIAAYRGDTVALAQLVGAYTSIGYEMCNEVHVVLPREWRGTMPDGVVVNRVKRATGGTYPEHISDAVGIGLSALGKL